MKTYKHDEQELAEYVKGWKALINGPAEVTTMQRTKKQNDCLHEACGNLATAFNDGGLDMRKVLKPGVDIPWTKESVKEYLFNSISEVMFDGRTSSQLDTKEIQEVWQTLMRFTGEKHGVTVNWPDRFGE